MNEMNNLARMYKLELEEEKKKYKRMKLRCNRKFKRFSDITYELLRGLGLSDNDIIFYYKVKQNESSKKI